MLVANYTNMKNYTGKRRPHMKVVNVDVYNSLIHAWAKQASVWCLSLFGPKGGRNTTRTVVLPIGPLPIPKRLIYKHL